MQQRVQGTGQTPVSSCSSDVYKASVLLKSVSRASASVSTFRVFSSTYGDFSTSISGISLLGVTARGSGDTTERRLSSFVGELLGWLHGLEGDDDRGDREGDLDLARPDIGRESTEELLLLPFILPN